MSLIACLFKEFRYLGVQKIIVANLQHNQRLKRKLKSFLIKSFTCFTPILAAKEFFRVKQITDTVLSNAREIKQATGTHLKILECLLRSTKNLEVTNRHTGISIYFELKKTRLSFTWWGRYSFSEAEHYKTNKITCVTSED